MKIYDGRVCKCVLSLKERYSDEIMLSVVLVRV